MNKIKLLLFMPLILFLVGCHDVKPTPQPPQVITTVKYVVKIPPAEMLTLPPPVPTIDPDKVDQVDVSKWMIAKEAYEKKLENMIIGIAQFLREQQEQLNSQDKK